MPFIRSKRVLFPFGFALLLSLLVVVSLSFILKSYFQPFGENWQHLIDHLFLPMIGNTLSLLILNILGCFFLGVALAWSICRYDFFGYKWLQGILILPLAIPPYVTAFIMFDVFDTSGHLNDQIKTLFAIDLSIDIQNIGFTSVAMVLVFYPYVYWLVRSSLLNMQSNLVDGAINLGLSEWQMFCKVVLPLTRPAIIAGLSLVIFETLADFGTVSIFNIDTLTTLIYKMWFSFFDLRSALQLSGILLLLVVVFYIINQLSKGKGLTHNVKQGRGLPKVKLYGWKLALVSGFCWVIVLLSLVLPVAALLFMSSAYFSHIDWYEFLEVLWNTLLIGGGASIILVIMSFLLVASLHQLRNDLSCSTHSQVSQIIDKLAAVLRLGYIFPGSVIAMSLISVVLFLEGLSISWGLMSVLTGGSLLLLLWAYMVRFFAVTLSSLDGSISRLNGHLPTIAMNLGLNQWQIKKRVYLPNLKVSMMSTLVLVFVEIIKEMPATLMLRPSGWETLAINIYSYTLEGEWVSAATPALAMIFLCLFFMLFVFRLR